MQGFSLRHGTKPTPAPPEEWSDTMNEEMKDLVAACYQLIENYSEGHEDGAPYFVNPDRGWDTLVEALARIEGGAE